MIRPYNLMSWGITFVAVMALFWNEAFIHAVVVVLVACGIRFMGVDRVWTASVAACTCAVMFPSIIFLLSGDYVHALVVAAALTNVVPMLRFAVSGRTDLLYSKF